MTADVLVVGAGFGGLYALHALERAGFDAIGVEAGEDVGGTWYWNRYPGARCDVASFDYSYSFSEELQQEWSWTEKYATQPEILAYLRHMADRFDLRRRIRFGTVVTSAHWEEESDTWEVTSGSGETWTVRHVVFATGVLSVPLRPDIPGLADFGGRVIHTSDWPAQGVDISGRDLLMIGTGSSGVQALPVLARDARSVTVLQRTANYVLPARNTAVTEAEQEAVKATYPQRRRTARALSSAYIKDLPTEAALAVNDETREQVFDRCYAAGGTGILSSFTDLKSDMRANDLLADHLGRRIADIVDDPETARILTPHGYPVGAKRLCVGTDYYETYNLDHVSIHDVAADPIITVEADGVRTKSRFFPADDIVLATGFDAMTGALSRIDIKGRDGVTLRDHWSAGPRNYLGLAMHGFPNVFMIGGPGSPSVLANVVTGDEQHVDWVVRCLEHLREAGATRIEPQETAEKEWVEHVDEIARGTLFYQANSWYLGANVPGKPRIFMPYAGGFPVYEARCDAVAAQGYRGFEIA